MKNYHNNMLQKIYCNNNNIKKGNLAVLLLEQLVWGRQNTLGWISNSKNVLLSYHFTLSVCS